MLRHVESSVGERSQGKNKHTTRSGRACIVEWQVNLSFTPCFPVCTVRWLDWMFIIFLQLFKPLITRIHGFPLCLRRIGYLYGSSIGLCFFSLPLQLLAFIHIIRFPSFITGKLKCDCIKMHDVYIRPFIKLKNIYKMYYSYHQACRTHISSSYTFTHLIHVILTAHSLMEVDK